MSRLTLPVPSLLAIVAATACGAPPPPPPVPPGASGPMSCPPPLLRAPGRVQPSRIRLENHTADTLAVWIDRCFWHTFLAEVAPGARTQVPLPERLVAFPEGFRFHGYAGDRHAGVFTVPRQEAPILRLVLADSTRTGRDALARFHLDAEQAADTGEVGDYLLGDDGRGEYTAVFARTSTAILSWACSEDGRRHLVLSTARTWGADEVDVRVRADRGAWRATERWPVVRGLSDAASAPPERVDALTRIALSARELDITLTVPRSGSREAHAFDVSGLAEALAGRGCFAPMLGGRDAR